MGGADGGGRGRRRGVRNEAQARVRGWGENFEKHQGEKRKEGGLEGRDVEGRNAKRGE